MRESGIFKELHSRVFELTLALYRVTDFFPKGEPLRKHLREKANEVFGGILEYAHSFDTPQKAATLLAEIEAIKGYLEIARSLRWVRPINITVLEREYNFLADFLNKELDSEKKASPQPSSDSNIVNEVIEPLSTWDEFTAKEDNSGEKAVQPTMSDRKEVMSDRKNEGLKSISSDITKRQKKIVEYLRQNSRAKISDFYSFFNDISSKTIQRDLQDLTARNILKKDGEKRWTVYSLNNVR